MKKHDVMHHFNKRNGKLHLTAVENMTMHLLKSHNFSGIKI